MPNNRVLVTGGSRGIGAAVVESCKSQGYEVIVLDRDGDGAIHCDLSDPVETQTALEKALEGGPICRLVNNVGAVFPNSLENQTVAEFNAVMNLNLRSAFLCMQALAPGMRQEQFGRVVNISSRAALGKLDRSAYAASKAGLIGMTKTWALELASQGITANAVAPGPIATELFNNANPENAPKTRPIIEAIPVKRMGAPAEVANAVSFFLGEEAGFVTGQVLYVCGGMTVGAQHV